MGQKESKLFQDLAKTETSGDNFASKAKKLWNIVDADSSGELELAEAEKFFGMIHEFLSKKNSDVLGEYCKNMSKEDCVRMWFAHFDTDGNGKISWQEFKDTLSIISNPEVLMKKIQESKTFKNDRLRLMLSGENNAGKTSLLYRFIEGTFTDSFIPPAEEPSKTKTVKVNDAQVKLEVFDTCGQERFRIMTGTYYNQCHGVVLVFDLTNPASFERLTTWISQINHYTGKITPKILVGNKCDLKSEIKVTKDQIQELCSAHNMTYVEASAKKDVGVQEAFLNLATIAARAVPTTSSQASTTSNKTTKKDKKDKS